MGSSSPPTPQNPALTANTQQGYNTQAAVQNQAGSAVNQFNPYGSLTYQQTGVGPGGIPIYSSSVNFSGPQQGLYNTQTATQGLTGQQGQNLLAGANYGGMSPTQAIGNESSGIQGQLMGQWLTSQMPWLNQQTDLLKNQLENSGIMPTPTATSDPSTWGAYERAMGQLQQSQTMGVAGAASQFQPQAFQEASSLYQLPAQLGLQLSQYGAPQSPTGSLVQTPGFNTSAPNYEGDVNSAFQAEMQAYIAQQQQQGSLLSGLFGAGGNILGGMARAGNLSTLGGLFPA